MADLEPGIGVLGQDLGAGLLALADRANRHDDVRSGASKTPGGLLARAAISTRDDDELPGLIWNRVHRNFPPGITDRWSVT